MKRIYFTLFFLSLVFTLNAQETKVVEQDGNTVVVTDQQSQTQQSKQKKTFDPNQRRWSFGGNIGLSFWNNGTDILIGPKAYYHVSPLFLTGFGLTYIYSGVNDDFIDYDQHSFGGSVMGAIRPVQFLQFSVEYEGLYTDRKYNYKNPIDNNQYTDSFWNNAIYLGASFVSRNVSFGMRYDILYDAYRSAYSSAWSPVIGFYF